MQETNQVQHILQRQAMVWEVYSKGIAEKSCQGIRLSQETTVTPQEKFKAKQRAQSAELQKKIEKRMIKTEVHKTAMKLAYERAEAAKLAEIETDKKLLSEPIQCQRSLHLHLAAAMIEHQVSDMPGFFGDKSQAKLWIDPRKIEEVGKVIKNKTNEFRIMISPMRKYRHYMNDMLKKLEAAKQPGEQHERKEVDSNTSVQQVSP